MMNLKAIKRFFIEIFIFCIFSIPYHVSAETNLFTSIGIEQEYDTNVLFTRSNEIDDSITHVIPLAKVQHKTELFELSALAAWDSFLYWDNSDLNTTNQNYVLEGNYLMTERWTVSGGASYLKDTTLQSQLEETGVAGIRQKRERFDANAGTSFAASERSSIAFDYGYRKIKYEREGSVDNELNRFRLTYNRLRSNQVDVFSIFPEFTYGTSDQWDAYNSTLNFQLTHRFDPTLRGSFRVGVRNTQINYTDERDDISNWGGIVVAWIEKRDEVTVGRVSLNNQLQTRSNGEIVNVARLLCNVDHRLTERFGAGFIGGLYYTRPIKELEPKEGDTWYFTLSPSLFYRLTENHRLRLLYSYDQEIQPDLDSRRKTRQRIWLRLDFNFPHTWERLFS